MKTEREKRREEAEDRAFDREFDELYPPSRTESGNGHAPTSVLEVGARVQVVYAWRGLNAGSVGRVGYVVEKHPVGSTYDVAVKFVRKKGVDFEALKEIPGTIRDFRAGELELV